MSRPSVLPDIFENSPIVNQNWQFLWEKCHKYSYRNHQFGDVSTIKINWYLNLIVRRNILGPWRQKGARNKLKILIMSEMVNLLQHDANKNWGQFQTAFFKFDPVGEFSPCQKFFFKAKILISKQTTAKCNQIGNLGFGLGYQSKLF